MTPRDRRLLPLAAVLTVVAVILVWRTYVQYRQLEFLDNLHLVGFSTSMIGAPAADQEPLAHQRAKELGIDLFAAYRDNLEPDSSVRFQVAWMLITNESPEYMEFAEQHVAAIPWPEVRVWKIRRGQESLSPAYREKLLQLILSSPTSEARLAAGKWYHEAGKFAESEDAYLAAMKNGLFWDALDAADQLLASERYQADAVDHLISVVRDSKNFTPRAANSLLQHYDVREKLQPLVDSCRREPKDGPNRKLLVEALMQLQRAVPERSR